MCGVIGILNAEKTIENSKSLPAPAAYDVYRGLLTLQHRGQDAAGILSFDSIGQKFKCIKNNGLVAQVFDEKSLMSLTGKMAIGHTRYATVGSNDVENLQPMVTGFPLGCGLVHNGNLVNYHKLTEHLQEDYQLQLLSSNDLEVLLHLFCCYMMDEGHHHKNKFKFAAAAKSINRIMHTVEGGYAVLGLVAGQGMMAFRDPDGIRPLVLGVKESAEGVSYCLCSETVALSFLGFKFVRVLAPGEFIFIDLSGKVHSAILKSNVKKSTCMFEWVYFAGAEGLVEERSVYTARLNFGEQLARRINQDMQAGKINPDIVVPVPDSSRTSAIAVAECIKVPYREALIKNRYIQRSFILNSQEAREKAVQLKLSPVVSEIQGKEILLVDDSVVRGTTSKKIVELLRNNGAKKITLAITCPPIRYACFYGIDFPSETELVAHQRSEKEIAEWIGVDHIIYLKPDELLNSIGTEELCTGCISGHYPTPVSDGKRFANERTITRNNLNNGEQSC